MVPGHPILGSHGQFGRVLLQGGQIVEGVVPAELAGVKEAHEVTVQTPTAMSIGAG
jgi:hypothetical protein